jgi:hypothetical protein
LAQFLGSIRIVFGHVCLAELFDVLQAFGSSYRLASATSGSSEVLYGRLVAGFCRTIVVKTMYVAGDRRAG